MRKEEFMEKHTMFHVFYNKPKKPLMLIILLCLSGTGLTFAQTDCIEPIENIIPELKGLIQTDGLEPLPPKIPKPKIILDWTEKIH
jgi:hypothetical protein